MARGRALVKEGAVNRLKGSRSSKYYLYLLNDLLVVTKVNEKKPYTFTESRKMLDSMAKLFATHNESNADSSSKKAGDEPYGVE